jgi:hypothetical protein
MTTCMERVLSCGARSCSSSQEPTLESWSSHWSLSSASWNHSVVSNQYIMNKPKISHVIPYVQILTLKFHRQLYSLDYCACYNVACHRLREILCLITSTMYKPIPRFWKQRYPYSSVIGRYKLSDVLWHRRPVLGNDQAQTSINHN